jgi:trans-aconitate methyltransferase
MQDAIVQECPASVLDLGCGEGWLLRALKDELPDAKLCGLDAIPVLIEVAKNKSPEIDYHVFSINPLLTGPSPKPI